MQLTRSKRQDYYILNKKPLNMKDNDFFIDLAMKYESMKKVLTNGET